MKEKQKQKPSTTKINIIKKQKIAKEYCKYESEREGEREEDWNWNHERNFVLFFAYFLNTVEFLQLKQYLCHTPKQIQKSSDDIYMVTW